MKEAQEILNSDEAEVITLYPEQEQKRTATEEFWYKEKGKVKIDNPAFLQVLGNEGFRKFYIGKEYLFVKVEKNIVREVQSVNMKDFVKSYIRDLGDDLGEGISREIILSKVINQAPTLFSKGNLEFLPNLPDNFKKDARVESYIYFANCFVRVTKNGYTIHNYDELDGLIWDKQILGREFHVTEKETDFQLFISRICREDEKRINSLRSSMGYLLHCYKDPANAKAVIYMDEKIDDGSNGGCGKSLVGVAIAHMRKTLRLDGKNFKFDRFSFQSYELGTNVIDFNDCGKNFPFDKLFNTITDNMAIEKKNKDEVIVEFKYSPKVLLSTNFTVKGVDESTLRRQFIVEYSDHYNLKHKPEDEFEKRFFDDWSKEDWAAFDVFMIYNLQYYLKYGFVEYERVNVNQKKLVESTSEEFVEFMEEIELDERYDKKELHQKFIGIYNDYSKLHQKTFTGWIKIFAKLNGLKFEVKNSGSSKGFILMSSEK